MTTSNEGSTSSRGALAADVGVDGVRKTYGDVVAVDNVDLNVAAGEFFTLLGPSGSGKTTTLRMIAGFEQPDTGTITLGGEDITRQPPYSRDVNTVFQDYALFPHMSVGDNVAYGLMIRKGQPAIDPRLEVILFYGAAHRPHFTLRSDAP